MILAAHHRAHPARDGALVGVLLRLRPDRALGDSPDRAGCVNILTSKRFITPTSPGQACNSCLIEVERWEG